MKGSLKEGEDLTLLTSEVKAGSFYMLIIDDDNHYHFSCTLLTWSRRWSRRLVSSPTQASG